MSILIGADFVPTATNEDLFEAADLVTLCGEELAQLLLDADYRIFNLEKPLTDQTTPIKKMGPSLIASTKSIATYAAAKVDLLTLANNHIMDQGVQGLAKTRQLLRDHDISSVGVGENLSEAGKPFFFEKYGKIIGVYACAEHEFSIATETDAGANPFDPLDTPDQISAAKQQCDYLIVLYHGGKEFYRYPSPLLQKRCRKMVEKGANLVLCQHSHCIGCEERYEGGTIVYGQGNFLFDASEDEAWKTSLLVAIDDSLSVSYIPVTKLGRGVRLAEGETKADILNGFRLRSEEIKDKAFLESQYQVFAANYLNKYLLTLSGRESGLFRALNRLSGNRLRIWRLKRKYGKKQLLAIRNYVECEAHNELLLQGIHNAVL